MHCLTSATRIRSVPADLGLHPPFDEQFAKANFLIANHTSEIEKGVRTNCSRLRSLARVRQRGGEWGRSRVEALNAMEMRSPDPSKRSTRCSSHAGKRSRRPVAGENGMPRPEPTHGRSIPGVSYIATA